MKQNNFTNKKEIIFFDGDGTIWYPKDTKRKVAPHWIYSDKEIGEKHLEHLILTPSALTTLKKLKKLGKIIILISTHPHSKKEADILLKNKISHLKLDGIFDEFYSSRDYPEGKGEVIAKVLKKKHISKSKALMIGDSYRYDYMSAKKVGVDCFLIESEYMSAKGRRVKKVIKSLGDIL
ncbi:MAG: HAD hydrolase-like protein [Candidatus Staskawiczbacteria bacterium]|jgi:phosphoglycolate phosphatase-like HAD superfamily hydrolase